MSSIQESDMLDWRSTDMHQKNPEILRKIRPYLDAIKLKLDPSYSLIDIGCGEGYSCKYLSHENYLGVDIREAEIEAAKRNFPDNNFMVGDLFDLEGKWDVVVCSRVLIHIAPFEQALEKLKSLAKRFLFIIVRLTEEEAITEMQGDDGKFYFRCLSPERFEGASIFHETGKYSLVTYDFGDK